MPTNRNPILAEKISDNLTSISAQRSLETMRSFTSDNLLLKEAFTFSIKPINFDSRLMFIASLLLIYLLFPVKGLWVFLVLCN